MIYSSLTHLFPTNKQVGMLPENYFPHWHQSPFSLRLGYKVRPVFLKAFLGNILLRSGINLTWEELPLVGFYQWKKINILLSSRNLDQM